MSNNFVGFDGNSFFVLSRSNILGLLLLGVSILVVCIWYYWEIFTLSSQSIYGMSVFIFLAVTAGFRALKTEGERSKDKRYIPVLVSLCVWGSVGSIYWYFSPENEVMNLDERVLTVITFLFFSIFFVYWFWRPVIDVAFSFFTIAGIGMFFLGVVSTVDFFEPFMLDGEAKRVITEVSHLPVSYFPVSFSAIWNVKAFVAICFLMVAVLLVVSGVALGEFFVKVKGNDFLDVFFVYTFMFAMIFSFEQIEVFWAVESNKNFRDMVARLDFSNNEGFRYCANVTEDAGVSFIGDSKAMFFSKFRDHNIFPTFRNAGVIDQGGRQEFDAYYFGNKGIIYLGQCKRL